MRALFLTDFLDSSFFPLGLEGMGFGASESMPGDGEDSLKDRDSGEPSCDTMSKFPTEQRSCSGFSLTLTLFPSLRRHTLW